MSASAYRVASLLRQRRDDSCGEDTLRKITRGVDEFLSRAAGTPPVFMEGSRQSDSCTSDADDGELEVHLSVVAGVLEPREVADDVAAVDGVFLPTAATCAALDRQRAQEAQAMLNLFGALSAATGDVERISGGSSDESVAVFDADELANDTSSSDDDGDSQRHTFQHILELS